MNKGLALAGGEFVGFLNSDDVYAADDIISRVVEVVAEGSLDSCYGDIVYVDPKDSGRTIRYWKAGPFDVGNIKKGWMPPHPAFFVRRSIYRRFGGFNLAFPVVADYEIMLRFLYKHRISSGYLPRIILRKRTGGISNPTLLNVLRNNAACHKAWIANGLRPSWGIFVRKVLTKFSQLRPLP
jgi:glycosyltransferase involved in cell wall biosynthesis